MPVQVISKGMKNGISTAQVVVKTEMYKGKFESKTRHLYFFAGAWIDRSGRTYDIKKP